MRVMLTLPKCFAKVMLCQVHPEKKSMFPFKPNGLEMVRSDHPPNEPAALVEDPGDDALAPGHHLGRGGGVEGGEGLAGALGADGLAGAGGADGAAPAGDEEGALAQLGVLAGWPLPLPDQGGEPGAEVGVVLGVLGHRLKLHRVPVSQHLGRGVSFSQARGSKSPKPKEYMIVVWSKANNCRKLQLTINLTSKDSSLGRR